jgi:hypothetical protein
MPEMQSNGGGETSRLDRMEGLMALMIDDHVQFREEHKRLLTAQVLLTDEMRKLAESQRLTEEHLKALIAHTDERLNALIAVVDDIVRKRPPQP